METARSEAAEHDRHRTKEEAEKPSPHHDELDKALADSFPASDPPAVTGSAPHPGREREKDAD